MANSPQYPDLRWMPPKAWNSGRASGQPTLITIHTTEGSAHGTSAEDGAAYDQRRTDGTSAHYYVDSNSVIQCVRTTDRANTARANGNARGIHYELCGRSGSIDWAGPYAQAMLKLAAKQAARDAKRHGIPVRKLSAAQVRDGLKGFCGHVDITNAWHQSDHTDPGPKFPWSQFLGYVNQHMGTDPDTAAGGRKVTFVEISGDLPVLKQGDDEASVPGGTNWIKRAQAILSWMAPGELEVDGEYGKKTSAAVKAVMAEIPDRSSSNGTVIGEPEWRKLFGLWG